MYKCHPMSMKTQGSAVSEGEVRLSMNLKQVHVIYNRGFNARGQVGTSPYTALALTPSHVRKNHMTVFVCAARQRITPGGGPCLPPGVSYTLSVKSQVPVLRDAGPRVEYIPPLFMSMGHLWMSRVFAMPMKETSTGGTLASPSPIC